MNDNLGVTQFKSTPSDYNENIIPNLFNVEYPSFFGWVTAVTSPDPRSDLRNAFHSKGSSNFKKVNNPQIDQLTDKALETVDTKEAVKVVRQIQDILLENGQYGFIILYNYISRSAVWNYWHPQLKEEPSQGKPGAGYFIDSGHLGWNRAWIDQKDPSYQGRPAATL
jgi:ABC-type transport system substrate-binding protein